MFNSHLQDKGVEQLGTSAMAPQRPAPLGNCVRIHWNEDPGHDETATVLEFTGMRILVMMKQSGMVFPGQIVTLSPRQSPARSWYTMSKAYPLGELS